MINNSKEWVSKLIQPAGIILDGSNDWDIRVSNNKFFDRVKIYGSLGLGESYMDGWWECKALDQFFYRLLFFRINENIELSFSVLFDIIKARLLNLQSSSRAFEIGEKHYDLGNSLFVAMLGKTMAYSCGYFKEAKDLDSAQEAKFDLICRKLDLQPGQRVLDIGCGWGSFAKYAAIKYGVKVVGITVSEEQAEFTRDYCRGLPIEIKVQDYRTLNEKFDHIVSVGMIEHVGSKNYRTYMEVARKCLKDDGLFLLHTIGGLKREDMTDPWVNKYIFPNGIIPSLDQLVMSSQGLFILEDFHNFGADYDKTLMEWNRNFENAWPELKSEYDERFYRMWRYYLLSCAGAFRARTSELWQLVLSPHGVPGGYRPVR